MFQLYMYKKLFKDGENCVFVYGKDSKKIEFEHIWMSRLNTLP